jgi:hypothetical protein
MTCEAIAEAMGLGPADAEEAVAFPEATPVEEAVALASELAESTKVADTAADDDSTWDAAGTGASGISSPPATKSAIPCTRLEMNLQFWSPPVLPELESPPDPPLKRSSTEDTLSLSLLDPSIPHGT